MKNSKENYSNTGLAGRKEAKYEQQIPEYYLSRRPSDFPREVIRTPEQAAEFVRRFYVGDIEIFESMFILLLNGGSSTIGYAKISQGGVTGTVCDARIVAKYAVDSMATAVILVHNHPSGNVKPSDQDIVLTKQIREGLALLNVTLLDHIIITANDYNCIEA